MFSVYKANIGEGKYCLEAIIVKSYDGLNVYLGGGEKSHVGTVIISQPRPSLKEDGSYSFTTSTLNIVGHKDDGIARPLAEKLCLSLNQTVVVTAGVHVKDATQEDIQELLKLSEYLTSKILDMLVEK